MCFSSMCSCVQASQNPCKSRKGDCRETQETIQMSIQYQIVFTTALRHSTHSRGFTHPAMLLAKVRLNCHHLNSPHNSLQPPPALLHPPNNAPLDPHPPVGACCCCCCCCCCCLLPAPLMSAAAAGQKGPHQAACVNKELHSCAGWLPGLQLWALGKPADARDPCCC